MEAASFGYDQGTNCQHHPLVRACRRTTKPAKNNPDAHSFKHKENYMILKEIYGKFKVYINNFYFTLVHSACAPGKANLSSSLGIPL